MVSAETESFFFMGMQGWMGEWLTLSENNKSYYYYHFPEKESYAD